MDATALPAWAYRVAESLMRPLGRRWMHVQAAARLANQIALPSQDDEGRVLFAAALVHDIGYAEDLSKTGFHALDGARYLRLCGQEQLALLVAHHSAARVEARLRGISDYEIEFPFQDSLLDHALTVCDMSTSPDGDPIEIEARVAEVSRRYGPDHVTARAVTAGLPEFQRWRSEIGPLIRSGGLSG